MNMLRLQTVILASLILVSCGGKKKIEPPPQPPQRSFTFTETNSIVTASELEGAENAGKALKADFNLDGLDDLAVIRGQGHAQSEVDIYIQEKAESDGTGGGETRFFRGGTIRRHDDGRIIGLVSKSNKEIVDIILLVTYSNRPNEMIHYQNDGKSFTEVEF